MAGRPNRPPDISTQVQFPTEEAIAQLHKISEDHHDDAVRLLAAIVARLCPATEAIGNALAGVASGNFASLDPDVENQRPKAR